jgi:hypothetical protein
MKGVKPAVPTPDDKPQKGVSFKSAGNPPGLFISRHASKPTTTTKNQANLRKYKDSFYSIESPPMDADWKEAGPAITAYFNDIAEHILDKDK